MFTSSSETSRIDSLLQFMVQVKEVTEMLETILIILVVAWALGFFAFNIGGGLIHTLLVIALVVFIFRMIRRR